MLRGMEHTAYPPLPDEVEVNRNDQPPRLGTWTPPAVYRLLRLVRCDVPTGGVDTVQPHAAGHEGTESPRAGDAPDAP
jgi:hypothetical protein